MEKMIEIFILLYYLYYIVLYGNDIELLVTSNQCLLMNDQYNTENMLMIALIIGSRIIKSIMYYLIVYLKIISLTLSHIYVYSMI
jgi:hypothetical protein